MLKKVKVCVQYYLNAYLNSELQIILIIIFLFTAPLIGNFFSGVYYNPFLFGKLDVKTSFIRAGLLGAVSKINLKVLIMG